MPQPYHFHCCEAEVAFLREGSKYLGRPQLLDPFLQDVMGVKCSTTNRPSSVGLSGEPEEQEMQIRGDHGPLSIRQSRHWHAQWPKTRKSCLCRATPSVYYFFNAHKNRSWDVQITDVASGLVLGTQGSYPRPG